mgnify:FL=1
MSILSQLKNNEEKIISGYPMNGNISSMDKYNYNDSVNILGDTDYKVSFEQKSSGSDKKCLCINEENKLIIETCTENCKFKIKSEIPDNNYNDTNKSIRGEYEKGIIVNLTYNHEDSDKYGNNMLDLTNLGSLEDDIIMEITNPGIHCYDYENLKKKITIDDANLNDIYRNNLNYDSIELHCYISIKIGEVKHSLFFNQNKDILFKKMNNPTSFVLRFEKTDSRFNKCYIKKLHYRFLTI